MKPLPKTLQIYVDFIAQAGRPVEFSEVINNTPKVNFFRILIDRKLIKDVVAPYADGEPFAGPRFSKYVLTNKGLKHVNTEMPTISERV